MNLWHHMQQRTCEHHDSFTSPVKGMKNSSKSDSYSQGLWALFKLISSLFLMIPWWHLPVMYKHIMYQIDWQWPRDWQWPWLIFPSMTGNIHLDRPHLSSLQVREEVLLCSSSLRKSKPESKASCYYYLPHWAHKSHAIKHLAWSHCCCKLAD